MDFASNDFSLANLGVNKHRSPRNAFEIAHESAEPPGRNCSRGTHTAVSLMAAALVFMVIM